MLKSIIAIHLLQTDENLCSCFLDYKSMVIVGEAADGETANEMAIKSLANRNTAVVGAHYIKMLTPLVISRYPIIRIEP